MQAVAVSDSGCPAPQGPAAAPARPRAVLATWLLALLWAAVALAVPAIAVIGAKLWVFQLPAAVVLPVSVPLWLGAALLLSVLGVVADIRARRSASARR